MMILNWIHGSRSREFGLGSGSLYNSSVPPQQDICMLSATCRVPMTVAGALRLPWCACVCTLGDPTGTVSRSEVLNKALFRSLSTADLRTYLHCRPDSREFFSTAFFM
jgi:hypothetical protein